MCRSEVDPVPASEGIKAYALCPVFADTQLGKIQILLDKIIRVEKTCPPRWYFVVLI